MMKLRKLSIILASISIYIFIISLIPNYHQQNNTPPKVVITKPAFNDKFQWNSLIRYSINISDKEDGLSEYNEINPHEVILKTVYLPDFAKAQAYIKNEAKMSPEPKGLILLKSSTCFNCHTLKGKLIGPAFEDIAKRYTQNQDSIKMLANKVIKGSKSVWGIVEMPPNPEMKINDALEIVRWIMKNSTDPNIDYLPGIEGAFHTIPKPAKDADKGVYILTASYTDHGVPAMPQQHKVGKHTIVLKSN